MPGRNSTIAQSEEERKAKVNDESVEIITNYNDIPYNVINAEFQSDSLTKDAIADFTEIQKYYNIYKRGASFHSEGTLGHYVPANLKYKMASSLINKEARFMFAESPDIHVKPDGALEQLSKETKDNVSLLDGLVQSVLDKNKFEESLIKAARDCFIGKRVAVMVNFNEEDGITINFIPPLQFIYETKIGNPSELTKFVAFIIINDSSDSLKKRIFKKKYVMDDDGTIWLEETVYNGAGNIVAQPMELTPIDLPFIPAQVILNDGLTGDLDGESEIELLADYESWYSKLANADIDAERKGMNPIRYAVDMDSNSTKNLSSAAGSFWDLSSDQNLEGRSPQVGILESSMSYSNSLGSSLDRIKETGYEQVDMPSINMDSMRGSITSGKSLKAIYWPLIVRCKEKMKSWGPAIRRIVDYVIQGAIIYPDTTRNYIDELPMPVSYKIEVSQNTPIFEDEQEEKTIDLAEVGANVMSRKTYMQKWRLLSDKEVDRELAQIAKERQILEDTFTFGTESTTPYPNLVNQLTNSDEGFAVAEVVEDSGV